MSPHRIPAATGPSDALNVPAAEGLSDDALRVLTALAALPAVTCLDDRHDLLNHVPPTRVRAALAELLDGGWIVVVDLGRTPLRTLYARTPAIRDALTTPRMRERVLTLDAPATTQNGERL